MTKPRRTCPRTKETCTSYNGRDSPFKEGRVYSHLTAHYLCDMYHRRKLPIPIGHSARKEYILETLFLSPICDTHNLPTVLIPIIQEYIGYLGVIFPLNTPSQHKYNIYFFNDYIVREYSSGVLSIMYGNKDNKVAHPVGKTIANGPLNMVSYNTSCWEQEDDEDGILRYILYTTDLLPNPM